MKVKVDYGDGTEPEEIHVTDGSKHFHPYEDDEPHEVSVEVLEHDDDPEIEDPDVEDDVPDTTEVEVGYDPAAHTVTEVIGYAEDNPEQVEAIIAAEQAGKGRTTLLSHLGDLR